jgi:hypothetical protein
MSELDQPATIGIDDFDRAAIDGIQRHKTRLGAARRLSPFITEMEAGYPVHAELTDQARDELAQFERDGVRLGERLEVENQTLFDAKPYVFWRDLPDFTPQPPQLKHLFGPEPNSPGSPHAYRLNWSHLDGSVWAGIGVWPDAAHGTFSASHYAPSGNATLSAFAGIGVRLKPHLDWCHLAVRPFVQWTGTDILNHRDAMPSLNEKRRARGSGAIGIFIQSWDLSGGSYHLDADHYVDMWDRSELNPSGLRDYAGTADTDSLAVTILASNRRRYSIFVYCWAYVESQAGFAVMTRASSMISCHMPFMFVEEIEL